MQYDDAKLDKQFTECIFKCNFLHENWLSSCLGTDKQQAITWTNDDKLYLMHICVTRPQRIDDMDDLAQKTPLLMYFSTQLAMNIGMNKIDI